MSFERKIYFIRHGEKEKSDSHSSIVKESVGLTQNGVDQSRKTGNFLLENAKISKIVASPLNRTKLTADAIGEILNLNVDTDVRFRERILFTKELENETAALEFKKVQDNWDYSAYGGESLNQVVGRFAEGINDLLSSLDNGFTEICIVTHGRALQSYLHSIAPNLGYGTHELKIQPCSITTINFGPDGEILHVDTNLISHL